MSDFDFIPVNQPVLNGNEGKYLQQCIDTGWISSDGPFVAEFETRFAGLVKQDFGVAVTNGTAALDVAVAALGIGEGDEVILPAFAIISCVLQIVRSGATPVLVDSDPHTWNMDVTQVAARITPRTKAIMAVHIYGLPVDLVPLRDLADKHGLALIEDAAEVVGQTYRGEPCGSFGDISTYSFYANKHITTGEGGMVTTNSEELAQSCRSLRNLCFQAEKRFVHERLGWNLRMTNLQAALGLAQLERLDTTISRKREIGVRYKNALSGLSHIQLPVHETDYAINVYWVYGFVINSDLGKNAEHLMAELRSEGIGTRPFFCPLHRQPVLLDMGLFHGESYPVAEHLYEYGLYLPSGLGLTNEQVDHVVTKVEKVVA